MIVHVEEWLGGDMKGEDNCMGELECGLSKDEVIEGGMLVITLKREMKSVEKFGGVGGKMDVPCHQLQLQGKEPLLCLKYFF